MTDTVVTNERGGKQSDSPYAEVADMTAIDQIRPDHYGGPDNPYETIKVLEAWGMLESFCLSNVIKYVSRSARKGDRLTDLKKAAWYLNYEVERLEKITHHATQ